MKNLEILDQQEFFNNTHLEPLDHWSQQLIGYDVIFQVRVTNNKNESKDFTIVFQNSERTNALQAYSGFEMETADGCGGDESDELDNFLSKTGEGFWDDDSFYRQIIEYLTDLAETGAEEHYDRLLKKQEEEKEQKEG